MKAEAVAGLIYHAQTSNTAETGSIAAQKTRLDDKGDQTRLHHPGQSTDVKRTASVSRGNVGVAGSSTTSERPQAAGPKLRGPVPKAPPPVPSKARTNGGPQARDARPVRESIIDFADFIRSTGPTADGPSQNRQQPNRAGTAPQAAASVNSHSSSRTNRVRLQARDASVASSEDNSDLIDFIRRGPPSTGTGNPRIPRTVAPFRTTMDSDQMSGAVGGRAVDATIPDIRYSQSTNFTTDSLQSSVNSQSALLGRQQHRAAPGIGGGAYGGSGSDDGAQMMPKRKQRRARDPYAIDFSDEEADEETQPMSGRHGSAQRPPPPPQEESLADFLRNVPPPPPQPTVPFDLSSPDVLRQLGGQPKKKSSAPSLMARFSRSSSSKSSAPSGKAKGSSAVTTATNGGRVASTGGGGRGYVPLQVTMPPPLLSEQLSASTSGLTSGNGAGTAAASSSNGGSFPRKKFQPREPVSNAPRTDDLADFFRSTAPGGVAMGMGGDDGGINGPNPATRRKR